MVRVILIQFVAILSCGKLLCIHLALVYLLRHFCGNYSWSAKNCLQPNHVALKRFESVLSIYGVCTCIHYPATAVNTIAIFFFAISHCR